MRDVEELSRDYRVPLLETVRDEQRAYVLEPEHIDSSSKPLPFDVGELDQVLSSRKSDKKNPFILSPLRYPGSKRRLAKYVGRVLKLNDLEPDLMVEPFAGGASVALQMLNTGLVKKIGLMDLDPLVSAFRQTVLFDTDWLVRQIKNSEVMLERWHMFKTRTPDRRRDRTLPTFFELHKLSQIPSKGFVV